MVAVSARHFQSKIFMVMGDSEATVFNLLLEVNDDGEKAAVVRFSLKLLSFYFVLIESEGGGENETSNVSYDFVKN